MIVHIAGIIFNFLNIISLYSFCHVCYSNRLYGLLGAFSLDIMVLIYETIAILVQYDDYLIIIVILRILFEFGIHFLIIYEIIY